MLSARRVAALVACMPLVLLGACSDDPADGAEPDPTPSESGSASQSPSPSESPSESPSAKPTKKYPEDKSASKISAELVAVNYIKAYNLALRTGDTARMRHMAGPRCRQCQEFAEQVEEYYGAGGGIKSDGIPNRVTGRRLIEASSANRVIWVLDIQAAAGETTRAAGEKPIRFAAKNFSLTFIMAVTRDRWVVRTLGFAS